MVIWREHKANSVGFRNAVYEAVIAGKKHHDKGKMTGRLYSWTDKAFKSKVSLLSSAYERQVRMQNEYPFNK